MNKQEKKPSPRKSLPCIIDSFNLQITRFKYQRIEEVNILHLKKKLQMLTGTGSSSSHIFESQNIKDENSGSREIIMRTNHYLKWSASKLFKIKLIGQSQTN